MTLRPILVLGAGINGAAVARELVLNGVPVCVVDKADIASGTTAYSSRLIHGGLRYLEFREFALVRESLEERNRLLKLAPQFVRPLRLFIPVRNRFGGAWTAASRFFGSGRVPSPKRGRGLWLVEAGLSFYDAYARDSLLPKHRRHKSNEAGVPPVDASRFPWMCSYYDAQIQHPETFTCALLDDARRLAQEQGLWFRVHTYCEARLHGRTVDILAGPERGGTMSGEAANKNVVSQFEPAAIVNATGAWVDETLAQLKIPAERFIGGTKGSHLVLHHAELRAALDEGGIYAEASDGRPVFILPLGNEVLVGTTDLPFSGDPAAAVADESEIDYLLDVLREVFPAIAVDRASLVVHYSGVRPLPYVGAQMPAGITRRHAIYRHEGTAMPVFSLVGGKLTTCRSFAEEVAAQSLPAIGRAIVQTSRDRPLPGAENYPASSAALANAQRLLAEEWNLNVAAVQALWHLFGTRTAEWLTDAARHGTLNARTLVPGTHFPEAVVRTIIERHWVEQVEDLVERRLMLLYEPNLNRRTLERLAELLCETNGLPREGIPAMVEKCAERLKKHFGRRLI